MKISRTLATLVAGIGLGVASMTPVHAAPIASWNYSLEAGFTNIVPAGVTASGDSGANNMPTKMAWGTGGDGPSSLVINPDPSAPAYHNPLPEGQQTLTGIVQTSSYNNPLIWANGTELAHNNHPISGTELQSARIFDYFTLTSGSSTNANQNPFFFINFQETQNFPDTNPPCPSPSGDNTGCMDIFVLDLTQGGLLGTKFVDGRLAVVLDHFQDVAGYWYDVLLSSNPDAQYTQLQFLTNDQCAAAGAGNGCVGMLTKENLTNRAALQFAVVVPEPGMLVLFGTGLLGLAGLRRRKSA